SGQRLRAGGGGQCRDQESRQTEEFHAHFTPFADTYLSLSPYHRWDTPVQDLVPLSARGEQYRATAGIVHNYPTQDAVGVTPRGTLYRGDVRRTRPAGD